MGRFELPTPCSQIVNQPARRCREALGQGGGGAEERWRALADGGADGYHLGYQAAPTVIRVRRSRAHGKFRSRTVGRNRSAHYGAASRMRSLGTAQRVSWIAQDPGCGVCSLCGLERGCSLALWWAVQSRRGRWGGESESPPPLTDAGAAVGRQRPSTLHPVAGLSSGRNAPLATPVSHR